MSQPAMLWTASSRLSSLTETSADDMRSSFPVLEHFCQYTYSPGHNSCEARLGRHGSGGGEGFSATCKGSPGATEDAVWADGPQEVAGHIVIQAPGVAPANLCLRCSSYRRNGWVVPGICPALHACGQQNHGQIPEHASANNKK